MNPTPPKTISPHYTPDEKGIRKIKEPFLDTDYRQTFSIDADRILNSLAFTRYIDKTQVFSLIRNDHISHRILHVQLVSRIARTIGRFLGLNEDLIEAISLGHDLGHTPFGHEGEKLLSTLCRTHGIGYFKHNCQSVQFLAYVERKGEGYNLCLQTLDGILSHDGEVHDRKLKPNTEKTFATHQLEMDRLSKEPDNKIIPMTLEGCAVRFADVISYIGRDIEDAIRLKVIKRSDLPPQSTAVLGATNGTIVYKLVTDVINQSKYKDHITFSHEIYEALGGLRAFNLERIYRNPMINAHLAGLSELFAILFERYLKDLEQENMNSIIYHKFLNGMATHYLEGHNNAEIVRDFIAGMTDDYFLRQFSPDLRPNYIEL